MEMEMKMENNVNNESVKYVIAILKRIEKELRTSQSSGLAMGFLDFDRIRTFSELDAIKDMMTTSHPVDLPETHPDSVLILKE